MKDDPVLIEIENEEAVEAIVMGLLVDKWTVQLFDRPGDWAIRAWKDKE